MEDPSTQVCFASVSRQRDSVCLPIPRKTTVADFKTFLVEQKQFGIQAPTEISYFTLRGKRLDETMVWPGNTSYDPKAIYTDIVLVHTPEDEPLRRIWKQFHKQNFEPLVSHGDARHFVNTLIADTQGYGTWLRNELLLRTGCYGGDVDNWRLNGRRCPKGDRIIAFLNTIARHPQLAFEPDKLPVIPADLEISVSLAVKMVNCGFSLRRYIPVGSTVDEMRRQVEAELREDKIFGFDRDIEISHFTVQGERLDGKMVWPGQLNYNPKNDMVMIHTAVKPSTTTANVSTRLSSTDIKSPDAKKKD